MLVVLMNLFLLRRIDYALLEGEENVLTEQIWFLQIISYWEVVTSIFNYLWLFLFLVGMIFFDLFWNVKLFIAAK